MSTRAGTHGPREFLFREVNERIAELTERFALDGGLFVCECASDACADPVEITLPEYVATRAHPGRFVVLPGHERPERERVVDANDRFVVVEKLDAVRKADPEPNRRRR